MFNDKTNEQTNTTSGNHGSKKSLLIVIIFALIIIGILVGVIIYLLSQKDNLPSGSETATTKTYNNIVMPENVEEIVSQMKEEERTPVGSYEVSMNTNWVFPDGNSASTNAYVENSTSNQNTVYFTITLKDSDEEILHSPYMMVGSRLADIKLNTALSKGVYDAVITYHLVDEDFKDLSSVSMYMKITIEN